jgi:hypothetical protein
MELAACALTWANQAGPEIPQARALMERFLETSEPALIEAYSARYGPAYHDFLSFKLGTWYAQIGDATRARARLTAVRDTPRMPEYKMARQMAEAFLDAYLQYGAYAGCVAVDGLIDVRTFPTDGLSFYSPFDAEAMRAAWGFSGDHWSMGGDDVWADPALQRDDLNLCNPISAFRLGIQDQTFASSAQVAAYLTRQGIAYEGLQETDMDGDGRRDWLVLVGTGYEQGLELWALLSRATGVEAEWVGGSAATGFQIPTTVATWVPTSAIGSLTVYQWSTDVAVLRTLRLTDSTRVLDLMGALELRGLTTTQIGLAVRPHVLTPDESVLVVRQSGQYLSSPDELTLGWDPRAQAITLVDRDGGVARARLSEAERLLFVQQDPSGANAILEALLADPGSMPLMVMPTTWRLATFTPYALYLRGLAAERSGHSDQAIQTYWTLWNSYPTHPFSAIVQRKLTPRSGQP